MNKLSELLHVSKKMVCVIRGHVPDTIQMQQEIGFRTTEAIVKKCYCKRCREEL